jgi:uncharacterized membrane protein
MADEVLFGPISFLAVGTTEMTPEQRLAVKHELKRLRDAGTIRILDAVYAQRDQFGKVTTKAASDLTTDDRIKLGVVIGGLVGYGMDDTVGAVEGAVMGGMAAAEAKKGQGVLGLGMLRDNVREMVPAGAAVLVLLVEHTWAKALKQSLKDAGAVTLNNFWVTPEMFVEAGVDMRIMTEMSALIEASDMYLE